jgi:hypothetical protein
VEGWGDDRTQLGLIAQEVQKIVPEVVRADGPSQMLSVNYTALVPVMIKAVQEQQKIIEWQEARIDTLERRRAPLRGESGGQFERCKQRAGFASSNERRPSDTLACA